MLSLAKNDDLLNFCCLSSNFYNYVKCSGDNFKTIQEQIAENKATENDIAKNFNSLNNENLWIYYDNLSSINNKANINNNKINFIKKVFKIESDEKEKEDETESILSKLKENFKISMLANGYQFVELISQQTMNFLLDIYELIFNLFKNMEDSTNKKIQEIIAENLLSEDKLAQSKNQLRKEIIDLKNKIENQSQLMKKDEKMKEKLIENNEVLENKIIKLNKDIKNLQNQLIQSKKESKEKISLLKEELNKNRKESDEKVSLLKEELNKNQKESDEKVSLLKEELNRARKESNTKVSKEEYNKAIKESDEKVSLLKEELDRARKESNTKVSKEEYNKAIKESNESIIYLKNEIEKIKISNFDLIKKFEENKKEKKILHESYEKMKYLNYKILFDHFYKKEENQQNQPKANLDANTFVIWLNLLSIDNNAMKNNLMEMENENEELKRQKK